LYWKKNVLASLVDRVRVMESTMASQHRKHRGYRTQRIVSDYMRQWFPFADSAGAGRTGSDVLNVPFDVEVKARTGFNPKAALDLFMVFFKISKYFLPLFFNNLNYFQLIIFLQYFL
jgi:hypothetical protein